jgi:hypothetical protein
MAERRNSSGAMVIKNLHKPAEDDVTVQSSHRHKGLVYLGIGGGGRKVRHSYLSPAEARAVAHALLAYAEVTGPASAEFSDEDRQV